MASRPPPRPGPRTGSAAARLHRRAIRSALVADISEFGRCDGKLYLAGIRDLHDHTLAGCSMGERQTTDLLVAALVMALGRRNPTGELTHHADHGTQYTSWMFTNRLPDWKINGSYGSVGDCHDSRYGRRSGPR